MNLTIPFTRRDETALHVSLPAGQIVIAQSRNPSSAHRWDEVVEEAIRSPIGAPPIHTQDLRGRDCWQQQQREAESETGALHSLWVSVAGLGAGQRRPGR